MSERKRPAAAAAAPKKRAKATATTVEQCVEYYLSQGAGAEARRKLVRYIKAQFPAAEAAEVERRVLESIAAEEASDHDFIEDDEGQGELSDESDDESDDDRPEGAIDTIEGDGGDDLFDLDQFKKGGQFDEATALRAFDAWKRRRNEQRGRMMWQGPIDCPEIPEDAFAARAKQMNKNANDADRRRIAAVDAEIAAGGLSAKDLRALKSRRERYEKQIRGRPEA